jgi:hypothetical protein
VNAVELTECVLPRPKVLYRKDVRQSYQTIKALGEFAGWTGWRGRMEREEGEREEGEEEEEEERGGRWVVGDAGR